MSSTGKRAIFLSCHLGNGTHTRTRRTKTRSCFRLPTGPPQRCWGYIAKRRTALELKAFNRKEHNGRKSFQKERVAPQKRESKIEDGRWRSSILHSRSSSRLYVTSRIFSGENAGDNRLHQATGVADAVAAH